MAITVPASFKAAVLAKAGTHSAVQDRSLPSLSSGEVAIKVLASAINPVDWKIRDWNIFIKDYPAVLGSDAAGTIAALGPDVSDFQVGDRVFFQGIIPEYDSCTFQQYCKMPAVLLGRTPKNVTDDEASGISLAAVCALTAFYDKTGRNLPVPWDQGGDVIGKDKAIVVLAGSSSVGQYAIQFAKLSGYTRVVTSASVGNHSHLKTLGADVVLDRAKATVEDYKTALASLPVDLVFDPVGTKDTLKLAVEILQATDRTPNSHVVMPYNGIHEDGADPEATALGKSSDPVVDIKQIVGIGSAPHLRHLSEPMFKHLGGEDGYLAKGSFVPNRVKLVEGGLAHLDDAMDLNKNGVSGLKVVIRPFDE
ncbi:hypothetical protein HKX48_007065 [Thoreauomyces humboldtii]|nr:hypothetical protein HKX48_007065 [Thoreauomyces humboldtii]